MSKYIGSSAVNLSTTSADVTGNADIDGNLTVGGNLTVSGTTITVDHATAQTVDLGDNDKIRLGADYELQLWSDGTTGQISGDINHTGSITTDGLTVDGNAEISASRPILDMMCTGASNENLRIDVNVGTLRFRQLNDAKDSATERFHLDTNTGDISFYDTSGNAKFFWDASASSLGLGTTSPTTALTVSTDGTEQLTINRADASINAGNTVGTILFTGDDPSANQTGARMQVIASQNWSSNAYGSHITFSNDSSGTLTERMRLSAAGDLELIQSNNLYWKHAGGGTIRAGITADSSDNLVFSTGSSDSTAMTIDGSKALHIGTDSAGSYPKTGHSIRGGDSAIFSRTGSTGETMQVRRDNSNGEQIRFYRGASTINGAIGDGGGALYIRGNSNGIMFNGSSIEPVNNSSTGGRVSNTVDIGSGSYRFKDLYLSGGIQFDSRSNKLDDYEEGNWSPGVSSGTITAVNAKYTKIGRSVTVSALIYNISDRSSSNVFTITNLPYASCGACRSVGAIMMRYQNNTSLTAAYITQNTTNVEFYGVTSGGWDVALHSDWNNINSEVYFTATYNAD
jgi:hypothetical protein